MSRDDDGCRGNSSLGVRGEWPGAVALDGEGKVEQERLGEVSAHDLQADRQAVEEAGRHRDRRVAVQVGGEGETPVVARAGIDSTEYRCERTVRLECDVGVRGG